jgi:hypothetical protein
MTLPLAGGLVEVACADVPARPDLHRFDVEFVGHRVQLRRIDLVLEQAKLLREWTAAVVAEAVDRDQDDLDRLFVDEFRLADQAERIAERDANDERILPASERAKRAEAAKRGQVTGWSRKSRSNMLRTMAGWDMPGRWAMLTLTVHGGAWWDRYPDPATLKESLKAFGRRWQEHYGTRFVMAWKLEFQRRGAPHFHAGVALPDGVKAADVNRWCREAWHEVVCHPGRHGRCPGAVCDQAAHARYGARLDAGFSDRYRQAGSTFAAYFAKHGVWRSKEYQHETPGQRMRVGAAVLDLLVGAGAGERLRELALAWDTPGRWWGSWNIDTARSSEGSMTAAEAEAARLIARKVTARRSWRYVERGPHRVLVRRTLRAGHGEAGFWLLVSNPSEFRWWFLNEVRKVAALEGVERARYLAGISEPGARARPGSGRRARASGARPVAASELHGVHLQVVGEFHQAPGGIVQGVPQV